MDRLEKDQVKHELYDISKLYDKEQRLSTELGGLLMEEFAHIAVLTAQKYAVILTGSHIFLERNCRCAIA